MVSAAVGKDRSASSPFILGLPFHIFISVIIGSALAIGTAYMYGNTSSIPSGTASELYGMALTGELENGSYVIIKDTIEDIQQLPFENYVNLGGKTYVIAGYVTFESDPSAIFLYVSGSQIENRGPGDNINLNAKYYFIEDSPIFIIL